MNGSFYYSHFNTGEVSGQIRGRIDTKWYYSACQKAVNCLFFPYGNLKKRPGTKFIYSFSQAIEDIRFIPFVYSEDEYYAVCLFKDVNGYHACFFTLDGYVVDATGNLYVVDLPITGDVNLSEVQHVQKDDVLYLCHYNMPLLKITRIAEDNWTAETVSLNIRYIIAYGDGSAGKAQGVVPNIFLEPTKVELHFTSGGTDHVIVDDGNGNFSDASLSVGTIDYKTGRLYLQLASGSFDAGKPIYVKFLNISGNLGANAIAFHENRLYLGGLNIGGERGKQVIMGSVVGAYEDFVMGTDNNLAFIFEIASEQNNEIVFICSKNVLFVGTQGGQYTIYGGSYGITPSSISVARQCSYPASKILPVFLENIPVFVSYQRDQLWGLAYDYSSNSYEGFDFNLFNKDILKDKVKQFALQTLPFPVLYCVLEDGKLAVLHVLRKQGVMGWARWYMGDEESYDKVKAVIVLPNRSGNYEKVWIAVERPWGMTIENFTNPLYEDYFDAYYSDCSVEYNSTTATTTISVPYPDGTECVVLTDKGLHPNVVVSGGQITLQWEVNRAVIGLYYKMEVALLPFEIVDIPNLVSVNRPKSLRNISVYLYKSLGGELGINYDYQFIYRKPEDLMDNPVPLFTGNKVLALYDTMLEKSDLFISLRHRFPLPFNVVAIGFDFYIGDL